MGATFVGFCSFYFVVAVLLLLDLGFLFIVVVVFFKDRWSHLKGGAG